MPCFLLCSSPWLSKLHWTSLWEIHVLLLVNCPKQQLLACVWLWVTSPQSFGCRGHNAHLEVWYCSKMVGHQSVSEPVGNIFHPVKVTYKIEIIKVHICISLENDSKAQGSTLCRADSKLLSPPFLPIVIKLMHQAYWWAIFPNAEKRVDVTETTHFFYQRAIHEHRNPQKWSRRKQMLSHIEQVSLSQYSPAITPNGESVFPLASFSWSCSWTYNRHKRDIDLIWKGQTCSGINTLWNRLAVKAKTFHLLTNHWVVLLVQSGKRAQTNLNKQAFVKCGWSGLAECGWAPGSPFSSGPMGWFFLVVLDCDWG